MSPFEVFDPTAALDPSRWAGEAGAARLLQAAHHFPGGPTALVLALFFAPVGPGIPAGVLLARHVPLNPVVTFALYALSDVIAAVICHPIFLVLRRHGLFQVAGPLQGGMQLGLEMFPFLLQAVDDGYGPFHLGG